MAAKKSCQESKEKNEKDVLGIIVATALLNSAYTGSPEAGQISPVGIVLPKQLRVPGLEELHVPISG